MKDRLVSIVRRLDRLAPVATRLLVEAVVYEGACITALTSGEPPQPTGDKSSDRELAARVCSGCRRQWECLELELRWSGPYQFGAFGALPDDDRRALFPLWQVRRLSGGGPR